MMMHSIRRFGILSALAALAAVLPFRLTAQTQQQFIEPSKEELSMTAQPEVPGAAAVYLNREEITDDHIHTIHIYARIKVLTEAGKKYADVEVEHERLDTSYTSVIALQARTIHPDGTIIPFTGKPYDKLISQHEGERYSAKVFTLPDVQVGSILEYRYSISYDERYFISPEWGIQSELFTRKAHYMWRPTISRELMGADGKIAHNISWTQTLPHGAQVDRREVPAQGGDLEPSRTYELTMTNIPAMPEESFMLPMRSLAYRVSFYYTAYNSSQEYWQSVGKTWSKAKDKFVNAEALSGAVNGIVAATDTPDQKLRKIYAAVMTLENTDFTRERTSSEGKTAAGKEEIQSAADIWRLKRGSSDQIADLFVGMARAAHLKAYAMVVADRSQRLFQPEYMSLGQLDDEIAIVNVDGKEQFFDPGARYCRYGHLAWQHTNTRGMRQTDDGPSISQVTPPEAYTAALTQRAADLVMAPDGSVSGTVVMVMDGTPALYWRQLALRTDDTGVRKAMKESLEGMLPAGMEVEVTSTGKLTDYESKLVLQYNVKGNLGSATGKRIILPADPFSASAKAMFPQEKRETPIYFHYPYQDQNIFRVRFPEGFKVESAPAAGTDQYRNSGANSLTAESTPNSITVHRDIIMADTLLPLDEYSALRTYYSKMEQRAQENIVLDLPAGGN